MSTRTTSSQRLIELEQRHGADNYHPLDVVLTRGEGCWVWDVDGNRYLDCLAAYSAVNQGHCHPRLIEALTRQAQHLTLCSRAFRTDQLGPFCQELTELTGLERVLPMNTGAEAVETAIKAARRWGYTVKGVPEDQAEIIVFEDNFHGRTTTIISFSTEPDYRDGFGPLTPGFKIVPFGDAEAVAGAITPNTVAVLMEPVQGEGGIIIPLPGTLSRIREICTRENVLLILDEIQSGLGRTGKMFAFEHENVRPDALTLGKALSGGMYPVSVFVADNELMDVFRPGSHGSTYGGNPLGLAVSREALRVLEEEGLVENACERGEQFHRGLAEIEADSIKEIRQIGLWIAIELKHEVGGARRHCVELAKEGLLCKETHTHTIRVAPPLVIEPDQVDWALERLRAVFARLG
ncbi:MAG: ornithine--oxo-acid transaminase [Acidobacteriota bacterium]|nr:MAG: ornithine--oxo-acid transaminase [Acidobacteriota bacterium]